MKFYFGIIYYCCFGLAMLYRLISDFTWHVSTGPEKENLIFSLFSATPGRDSLPRLFLFFFFFRKGGVWGCECICKPTLSTLSHHRSLSNCFNGHKVFGHHILEERQDLLVLALEM